MSSPVRTLVVAPTVNATVITRKRVLTDSEDTEERDSKRVRPQDAQTDAGKQKDVKGKDKEKKKKRKKKRKVPVVQADESDLEVLPPMHNAKTSHVRSRSVLSAGPSTINTVPQTKVEEPEARLPSAGPSQTAVAWIPSVPQVKNENDHDVLPSQEPSEDTRPTAADNIAVSSSASVALAHSPTIVKEEASTIPIRSGTDKGKAPVTADDTATSDAQTQATELQDQITTKTKLVTEHESLVSTLQQSLSCQICLDLMHRPFALSPCGHSACHQCLVNWFKAPPADVPAPQVLPTWIRKKTCPHCRAVVKDRPIEIWAIKEMVANLVKSGLAQGFYSPSQDNASGPADADPWAGIFRPERGNQAVFPGGAYPAPVAHLMGQRDEEDGVYRCIDCFHEIMDGVCTECGRVYPGHDPDLGSEYDDDDDSIQDIWRDEAEHAWTEDDLMAMLPYDIFQPLFRAYNVFPNGHIISDAGGDTEIESAGGDTEIESVGGDTEIESNDEVGPRSWRRRLPPAVHIENSDEEDEEGYESSFIDDGEAGPEHRDSGLLDYDGREATIALSDDDDDEVQFVARRRGPTRGRGPIIVESDEEEDVDLDAAGYSSSHDGVSSDEEHNRRTMRVREQHVDYESDEEDLAGEVAAREYALYGDDGSVPRRNYVLHRVEDFDSDEDDALYHSDHSDGSEELPYGWRY